MISFLLISLLAITSQQQTIQWAKLNTPVVEIKSGEIVLEFEIDSGFHIQSDEPLSDNLIPTTLEFGDYEGVTVERIDFPDPHAFELKGSDERMAVFDGKVRISIRMKIEAPMPLEIPGKFCYQVCDDRKCYFPRCLEFTLKIDHSAHK